MDYINMNSVMSKVRAFQKSEHGKQRVRNYLAECRKRGQVATDAGSLIITEDVMCKAAELMINILKQTAREQQLPPSVMEHFDSLTYSPPTPSGVQGESFLIDIWFKDDLSRMSLMLPGKPSDESQIDNIVSLFDTGYTVENNRRRGVWDGHTEYGVFAGLEHRDGKWFMAKAIEEFNRVWGESFGAKAVISADPQFYVGMM